MIKKEMHPAVYLNKPVQGGYQQPIGVMGTLKGERKELKVENLELPTDKTALEKTL